MGTNALKALIQEHDQKILAIEKEIETIKEILSKLIETLQKKPSKQQYKQDKQD